MKKLFLFLAIGLFAQAVYTQELIEGKFLSNYIFMPNTGKDLIVKADTGFYIYNRSSNKGVEIRKYNPELELDFSIPVENDDLYPWMKYDHSNNQFILFTVDKRSMKRSYTLWASHYDNQTGKLIKKYKILQGSRVMPSLHLIENSNRIIVSFSSFAGRKETEIVLFNEDYEEVYSKIVSVEKDPEAKFIEVDTNGTIVIVYHTKNDALKVFRIIPEENKVTRKTITPRLLKREQISDLNVLVKNDKIYLVTQILKKRKERLKNFRIYKFDINTLKYNTYESHEYTASRIKELYSDKSPEDVVEEPYRGSNIFRMLSKRKFKVPDPPEAFGGFTIIDIFIDETDNLYLIGEQLSSSRGYTTHVGATEIESYGTSSASNLMLIKFDSRGKQLWDNIILRMAWKPDNSAHAVVGGHFGLMSKSFMMDDKILIISPNYSYGTYYRHLNKTTGELTHPQRLGENKYISDYPYISLYDENTLLMVTTNANFMVSSLILKKYKIVSE